MTTLDLDQLRQRWGAQGRRIDHKLVLDVEAVRAALTGRAVSAFRRHARWLLMALVAGALTLAALAAFIVQQWRDWPWIGVAASLLPLLLAELVVDFRQWRTVQRLDWDAPVLQLRAELDQLRARRLHLAKWIFLLSVLLWLPVVLVLCKGVLGADLLRGLHPSVLWANLALGLAFIPFGVWIGRWLTRRFGGAPGWRRFLDDIAGASWRRASDQFAARERFETAPDAAADEAIEEPQRLPPEVAAPIRALRARLLLGILGCALLMLLMGAFNVAHGGVLRFILAGVLTHLSVVAHLVVQIVHRSALGNNVGGVAQLRDRLAGALKLRQRVATATVVAAPLLSLPWAVVIAQSLGAIDLVAQVAMPLQWMALGIAVVASALLGRRAVGAGAGFAPALIDLVCLGAIRRTRRLVEQLPD